MPTCRDETSEAETAAATRGGGKKSVRDVLVTTATIMPLCECIQRELTKRQNFKSRFWLKYIAGNRVPRFFIPLLLSFFCNVSACPPCCPPSYSTPCHLRRAFSKVEMHFHVRAPPARTYRSTKWTRAEGDRSESGVLFPVPLNWNRYHSVQKEFGEETREFGGEGGGARWVESNITRPDAAISF